MRVSRYVISVTVCILFFLSYLNHQFAFALALKHRYGQERFGDISSNSVYQNIDESIVRQHSALVVDMNNGRVLLSQNAGELRYPASLTKIMTLYIVFDALNNGALQFGEKIKVSRIASAQPRSKLGLQPGSVLTVREAVFAAIIKSANDATYALGERLGRGNVDNFVKMMNHKAKQLGMLNTNFVNPNGLHHMEQVTTAEDMAKLALAIRRNHSKYYHLFSTKSFVFKGRPITTNNGVLKRYPGATGLKTGFVGASGFHVITSVQRPEGSVMGVFMGGKSAYTRDMRVMSMLNHVYDAHFVRYDKSINPRLNENSSARLSSNRAHLLLRQKMIFEKGKIVAKQREAIHRRMQNYYIRNTMSASARNNVEQRSISIDDRDNNMGLYSKINATLISNG